MPLWNLNHSCQECMSWLHVLFTSQNMWIMLKIQLLHLKLYFFTLKSIEGLAALVGGFDVHSLTDLCWRACSSCCLCTVIFFCVWSGDRETLLWSLCTEFGSEIYPKACDQFSSIPWLIGLSGECEGWFSTDLSSGPFCRKALWALLV